MNVKKYKDVGGPFWVVFCASSRLLRWEWTVLALGLLCEHHCALRWQVQMCEVLVDTVPA